MVSRTKCQILCLACDTKVHDSKWREHCETKQHWAQFRRAKKKAWFYLTKMIFDSRYGTYEPLLITFIPKIPWKKHSWRVIKRGEEQ